MVVFAHMPLWSIYEPWGWGTAMLSRSSRSRGVAARARSSYGHIHRIVHKVEGHITFHTARSTACPQAVAGTAPGPGPLKVPADELATMLGVIAVAVVPQRRALALTDAALA